MVLSDLVEGSEENMDECAGTSVDDVATNENGGSGEGGANNPDTLILQDLFASDFRMADIDRDENGLDFTHTILAMARLATLHATSYCMRKEKNIDMHQR